MKYQKVDKDLLVVSIVALVAALLVFVMPSHVVFIRILTLPLVLILPGYALISALFPRHTFGVFEFFLFSLGVSLIMVILSGLVLNATPFGLRASSWSILLAIITLAACTAAFIRRRRQNITVSGWPVRGKLGLLAHQWMLLSLFTLLVCGTIVASIIGALQQAHPGFTQLWMLPVDGTGLEHTVQLGVSNKESMALDYSLDVSVNGKVVQKWPSIYLRSNEQWETTLTLPRITQATHTTGASRIEAMLYRADAPTKVYRNVVLWIGT